MGGERATQNGDQTLGCVHEERFRTTLVCIDGGGAGEISGQISNPYLEGGVSFSGTLEFLAEMEDLLDRMQMPQAYMAPRCFADPAEPPAARQTHETRRQGARATFAVRVLFRQNASWQGTVTWVEGKREENFRSVLELLLLVKSALDQGEWCA
jgi:hypothetical protein